MIFRKRIFEIIEQSKTNDIPSLIFDWFIIILISLNVISIILESFNSLEMKFAWQFGIFESISVIIFTIEIFLRLLTSDYKFPAKNKFCSLIKYSFSFMAIIDLLSVLPFYLPFFIAFDLRFLRILRLTRVFRILKIQRYNRSLDIIGNVLRRKKYDLIVTIFITMLLLLLSSSMMYYVENGNQPGKFPNIIASFWWAVATLTTVGYGDVYPVTILGKILSGIIALLGIGIVALPTGIISSGFIEVLNESNNSDDNVKSYCPYCGNKIDEGDSKTCI